MASNLLELLRGVTFVLLSSNVPKLMKLIVQPESGVEPILAAIKQARKSLDVLIFRLDRVEIARALSAAVARGVVVRALTAHTNRGGEKSLRRLELKLLE